MAKTDDWRNDNISYSNEYRDRYYGHNPGKIVFSDAEMPQTFDRFERNVLVPKKPIIRPNYPLPAMSQVPRQGSQLGDAMRQSLMRIQRSQEPISQPSPMPDAQFNPANAAQGVGAQSLWRNATKPSFEPQSVKGKRVVGDPMWHALMRIAGAASDPGPVAAPQAGYDEQISNAKQRIEQRRANQQGGSTMHPLDLARALGAQGAHMPNHPLNGAYNAAIQAFQQSTPRANQQAIAQRMAMQGRGPVSGNVANLPHQQGQPWESRLAQLSPDNPTDAARANQLEEVLRGNDMRFGPKSPESMFRQNVIRQPGMMGGVVHPMMPSYGGAAPRPAPQNNPAPSLTNQQAIDEWNANEGKARGRFMEMTPLGISASGNAYQSNPGQYAMGLNGLMGRMNKGPAVSFNERGEVVDMTGNPVTVDMMRQMSGQARSQLENQKISGLRTNARIRNAVTDAQRGRPGALVAANADGLLPGNVLNALFPQPAPFVQVGPDGRGVGGGGMNMAMPAGAGVDDKTNLVINAIMSGPGDEATKSRLVQSILFNKAAGGATQAGATEGKLRSGSRIAKAKEAISPPTAEDIAAAREQFPGDPGAFAEWGRNKGWNNEKINRALLGAYGPDVAVSAEYGANNPSFRIDPSTGVASPHGVIPGLVNSIMQMFGWDKPSTAKKSAVAPVSPLGRGIINEGGG